jgi:hypothetical protein
MSNQQNQVSLANSLINNAQQTINNYCSISCNANIGNANIQINGGNATIKIEQTCTNIGSECTIKNTVNAEIENLIDNLVQQQQTNGGFLSLLGPSQNNTSNISNAIKNQVSQLINNTCSQNVSVNLNNLNILSQNANTKLTYVQTGSQDHATCALDTVAKLVLNNQVSNSVKQTQSSCGNVLGILIAIAVVIVLIIVGFIVFKLVGKKGDGAAGKEGKESGLNENIVLNVGGGGQSQQRPMMQGPQQMQGPSSPGFYDRLKGYGNSFSNWTSNTYQSAKNRFTTPTSMQASGLNQIQVPTEEPVPTVQSSPWHNTSLTVGKMLYAKRNAPGFAEQTAGIPPGTVTCSDGGTNMKCPPTLPVDRTLNRVFDTFYAKQ